MNTGDDDRLLSPGEVRRTFGVTTRTVTRWASTGKLNAIRTPGGHRRFRKSDVQALLEDPGGRRGSRSAGQPAATPDPGTI